MSNKQLFIITSVLLSIVYGKIRIPQNPCPQYFSYYVRPDNGNIFGQVRSPYDGRNRIQFNVNASLAGYFRQATLKIQLLTPVNHIRDSQVLVYNIFFPFVDVIPKITQLQYNGQVFCSGPPEPLITGTPGVTNIWASNIFAFDTFSSSGPDYDNIIPSKEVPNYTQEDTVDTDLPVRDPNLPTLDTDFAERNPFFTEKSTTTSKPVKETQTPRIENNNALPPNKIQCGLSKNPIVPLVLGGKDTKDGLFPWLAAMFVSNGNTYQYRCTATLITNNHVITAARCLNFYKVQDVINEAILLVFGSADVTNWATNGALLRGAKHVETHPEYNADTGHGDVSVITLNDPIQFTDKILPICLWEGDNNLDDIIGKRGTLAGWGTDENPEKNGKLISPIAKYIDMPIVSQDDCLYSNFTYGTLTTDLTFCAGDRNGRGPCIGDVGAGFMMQQQGKYYLRGLASINQDNQCQLNSYIIFCDVAKCKSFIDKCIQKIEN